MKISCTFAGQIIKCKKMDTVVLEDYIGKEQWQGMPARSANDYEKMSFEDAVTECNAVPLETFITELKKRVKERYKNAKS